MLSRPNKEEIMNPNQPPPPPPAIFMQLGMGKMIAQSLSTMAELKVADQLKDGPKTAAEIAPAVGAHAPSLHRVMRALAMVGVFAEQDGDRFALTPVGDCLRTDVPGSLRNMAVFMGQGWHSAAWSELAHSVRTGEPAFDKAHGAPVFEWAKTHPKEWAIFNDAMTSMSSTEADAVVKGYDFTRHARIADVGGGHGYLLAEILRASAKSQGVLFDMPQVVEGAKKLFADRGLSSRVEIVGGDFFATVPAGCDAYVMKHIIHDWSDAHCEKLLKHCRDKMNDGGRVLVIEMVVPPPNVPGPAKLIDLEMLTMTHGGRERTERELAELFGRAGLALVKAHPTQSAVVVLEAKRA
jgi:hypothetical protein